MPKEQKRVEDPFFLISFLLNIPIYYSMSAFVFDGCSLYIHAFWLSFRPRHIIHVVCLSKERNLGMDIGLDFLL